MVRCHAEYSEAIVSTVGTIHIVALRIDMDVGSLGVLFEVAWES